VGGSAQTLTLTRPCCGEGSRPAVPGAETIIAVLLLANLARRIGRYVTFQRMNPTDLFPALAPDLEATDRMIRRSLASEVVLVGTISDYIIGSGGKRIRPLVLLAVSPFIRPRCSMMMSWMSPISGVGVKPPILRLETRPQCLLETLFTRAPSR